MDPRNHVFHLWLSYFAMTWDQATILIVGLLEVAEDWIASEDIGGMRRTVTLADLNVSEFCLDYFCFLVHFIVCGMLSVFSDGLQ